MYKSKFLVLILVMTILVSFLGACTTTGTTTGQTTASTSTKAVATSGPTTTSEPPTISTLISVDTFPVAKPNILLEINKRTGINWSPTYCTSADYDTKISSMAAGGTLPDIYQLNLINAKNYAANKQLLQLDELLKKYGSNILEDRGTLMTGGLNKSGLTYGIPKDANDPTLMCIRTDWLKSLGLKMPTNLDEFYTVLHAFVYDDPDKNSKKDTLGVGLIMSGMNTFGPIFEAFGFTHNAPVQLSDGTITSFIKHPNFMLSIGFLRKLYSDGLMESDFATIDQMSEWNKLWNGKMGAVAWGIAGTTNNWLGRYTETVKPTMDYVIFNTPDGKSGKTWNPKVSAYTVINTKCKYPDAVIKLLDYFTSAEGDELLYLGIEGIHFKWADKKNGQFEYIQPYTEAAVQRADGGFIYWDKFHRVHNDTLTLSMKEVTQKGFKLAYDNPLTTGYIFETPETAIKLGQTLADIEKETIASLIVSKGDINAEYKTFVDKWMREGGETWEKQATLIWKNENSSK